VPLKEVREEKEELVTTAALLLVPTVGPVTPMIAMAEERLFRSLERVVEISK
jgi:hypothetical protein